MVAVLVCAVLITAAVLWPRPVGDPANPAQLPDAVLSTWVVVDVSRAVTHYLGPWGFAGFTLLGLGLALVPLFDREPERELRRRPVITILGLTFFLAFAVAWVAGRQLRSVPHAQTLQPQAPEEPMSPPGPRGAAR
jgi:quinol-cytochrome oxidoreductase complex cytochrome b subunit